MTKEVKAAPKKTDELIDGLLAEHGISREWVLGLKGLVARLTQRVVEKALAGEITFDLYFSAPFLTSPHT